MCDECHLSINQLGDVIFLDDELLHCHDGPAIITPNYVAYYRRGKRHRDGDESAMIYANGDVEYWVCGEEHRDGNKPAVILSSGHVEYWVHGCRHRDDDQPAIICIDGSVEWWVNGKFVKYGHHVL